MKKSETKENSQFSALIEEYSGYIESAKNDLAAIEEKYRKLKEEESNELNDKIVKYEKVVDGIKALIALMNDDAPAKKDESDAQENTEVKTEKQEEVTEQTSNSDTKEEEPKIMDTLFPENNEPETGETTESNDTQEPASESEVITQDEAVSDDTSGFAFQEDNNEESQESSNDDEWPDMPQEWQ